MRLQKKYEVIRLIKQNVGCHMVMDYVEGQILAEYVRIHPDIEKEKLFLWIRQIVKQLEYIHEVKRVKEYRYVTPFCMVVKNDQTIAFLDLNAKSNESILDFLNKEMIRKSFFPSKELYDDFYSLGKTIQFLLAQTCLTPALTRKEEAKFKKIVSKCLSGNSKKGYQNFSDIVLQFPQTKNKKILLFIRIILLILAVTAGRWSIKMQIRNSDNSFQEGTVTNGEEIPFFEIGMAYFLKLEDYERSKQMFKRVKDKNGISKYYEEMCSYMLGESKKTKSEMEELLKTLEKQTAEESNADYMRSILKVYMKINTDYADKMVMKLGEKLLMMEDWKREDIGHETEQELRKALASVYEKKGVYDKALEQYKCLSEWIKSEAFYLSMLRISEKCSLPDETAQICLRGIQEYPKSKELRVRYIQIQCTNPNISKEESVDLIKHMIQECPELLEDKGFQKLQIEYGIVIEGEDVWLKK